MTEKVVFEGKIIEVLTKPVKLGDKVVEFERARRSPGTRLLIVKNKEVLLTKEYRHELNDYDYRLPGGKVFDKLKDYSTFLDTKKDILEPATLAAKKECLEEAGILAKDLKLIKVSKAGSTIEWDLYYFLVEYFEEKKQNLELGEDIKPEWFSFQKAKMLCLEGKVNEDRSLGILLKYLCEQELA